MITLKRDKANEMVNTVMLKQYEATQRGELSMWTIYREPKDWPHGYMARQHLTKANVTKPAATAIGTTEHGLELLREILDAAGLVCMTRHPDDEPHIVEVWL